MIEWIDYASPSAASPFTLLFADFRCQLTAKVAATVRDVLTTGGSMPAMALDCQIAEVDDSLTPASFDSLSLAYGYQNVHNQHGILLVVLAILCLILLGLSLLADYGLTKLTSSPTLRGRATPQEDARLIVEL